MCTDETLTAMGDKDNVAIIPQEVTQQALWVHFGGSGGQPTNTTNIGKAAAHSGYRFLSIAYPNEPSVAARCSCPEGPRPSGCEGLVRAEILYGTETTDMYDMMLHESLTARVSALIMYLDTEAPNAGWSNYLTEDNKVDWTRTAVSGFSQGGGMAGMIARDHLVQRAVYFSKGAGSIANAIADPASATACSSSHDECTQGRCCSLERPECQAAPAEGGICLWQTPVAWVNQGADTNGDGVGDGDASTRATPASRQFAIVHRDEGAWHYSPLIFDHWGLGTPDSFEDADAGSPPYNNSHLLSTGLPPAGSCSEHQSMGADTCQPKEDGVPLMWNAWKYMMSAPVE